MQEEENMSKADYKFSTQVVGQELLHTPEGVRDIYGEECARKVRVQETMHHVLKLYGFNDIQTPTYEFFDIFSEERGTVAAKDMYRFFDREGNMLALRPDITPSIARCVAKYYRDEELPIRLCYSGNTFINNSSYQGKLKETTQIGAELINDDTSDADAEMLAITIECLLKCGIKELQIEVGHVDFFNGIAEEGKFTPEEKEELRNLLIQKNMFGVERLIEEKHLQGNLKELFLKLPQMFGNLENLSYAKTLTGNEKAIHAINRLEKLYAILKTYELNTYVTFDLGMLSEYSYYTGIIYKAYTYGTGEPLAKGGRYGALTEQFGKKAPAIGLAIEVDQVMMALSRQKIDVLKEVPVTIVLYKSEYRRIAIDITKAYREKQIKIQLVRMASDHTLQEYKEFALRYGMEQILYIEDEENAKLFDLQNDGERLIKIQNMLER